MTKSCARSSLLDCSSMGSLHVSDLLLSESQFKYHLHRGAFPDYPINRLPSLVILRFLPIPQSILNTEADPGIVSPELPCQVTHDLPIGSTSSRLEGKRLGWFLSPSFPLWIMVLAMGASPPVTILPGDNTSSTAPALTEP